VPNVWLRPQPPGSSAPTPSSAPARETTEKRGEVRSPLLLPPESGDKLPSGPVTAAACFIQRRDVAVAVDGGMLAQRGPFSKLLVLACTPTSARTTTKKTPPASEKLAPPPPWAGPAPANYCTLCATPRETTATRATGSRRVPTTAAPEFAFPPSVYQV